MLRVCVLCGADLIQFNLIQNIELSANKIPMETTIDSYQKSAQNQLQNKSKATNNKNIIPIIPLQIDRPFLNSVNSLPKSLINPQQKIIPGYNFQSLFRKKSHIRLAKKRQREEAVKNSSRSHSDKIDNGQKQAKNVLKGHWTLQQNKFYHWFLQLHNRHFILKHLRRTDKIFKSMAQFIKTRQAEQCRSHHQKMEKKYKCFYQILLRLRTEFYNSAQTELLRVDLQENGYKVNEQLLLSEIDLRGGTRIKVEQITPDNNEEDGSRAQRNSQSQQSQLSKHNNIMGQNYQKGLEFHLNYDG